MSIVKPDPMCVPGSITSLTDETGNIVQEYRYDSFGNITHMKEPTFVQPFTFTAREYDPESGLYHYRERTYDSNTGTFISEDPIGFKGGDVNLMRMVGNNVVNYTDPFGLICIYWMTNTEKTFTNQRMIVGEWNQLIIPPTGLKLKDLIELLADPISLEARDRRLYKDVTVMWTLHKLCVIPK